MRNDKLMVGILSCLAIGVVAALLFAPDKGSKTRKRMMQSGSKAADRVKNKTQDMIESAESKYVDAIQMAEQKIKKLISAIPDINK